MTRIASLAGPVEIGGDYFRWVQAARSDQATPSFDDPNRPPPNVGDWFVTKIVDRLIEFDEVFYITPYSTARDWDEMNETCDLLLLKGGNYLYPGWFEQNLPPASLDSFRIPIVMFGAGIQNVPAGGVPFTADDVRALEIIHANCHSSGVRGELSAQVLADHGITNATVTGCPTLYWARAPKLHLKAPSFERVGFTLRNHLFSDDLAGLRAQYHTLQALISRAEELVVVLQGEDRVLQLHHLVSAYGAEYAGQMRSHGDQSRLLTKVRLDREDLLAQAHRSLDALAGPELVDWLAGHSYASWDPDDYIRLYQSCGLVIGCRLHSNLLALANGTPAYFLTYDDRTRELALLLGAPSSDVESFEPAVLDEADWSSVERRYEDELFPRMVEFLEKNSLSHRLPSIVTAEA